MRRLLWLPLALILLSEGAFGAGEPPVGVVELFTSQGCSSCPPADRLLGELAKRDRVVALAFHVKYWDRLGWPDPFATDWGTDRQYGYTRTLGRGYAYTPQMVIDGVHDVVGSDREAVEALLARDRTGEPPTLALALAWAEPDHRVRVSLPAGRVDKGPAAVWLVRYDGRHGTDVARGENGGRRLVDFNVVREMRRLGDWSGKAVRFEADVVMPGPAGGGVAVLVQQPGPGRILGAARLAYRPAS